MTYSVEIWDNKYPYSKSLKVLNFDNWESSYKMALLFAELNPVTIWKNNIRIMDIG